MEVDKEKPRINVRRKVNELEGNFVTLTENAYERYAILITMLEMTICKIKAGRTHPILLRPWEIKEKGHRVGSIRNAIDKMKATSPPIVIAHEKEAEEYVVTFTNESVQYLYKELAIWDEISRLAPISTLRRTSLEIIRELLDELKRLLQGPVP